MSQIFDISNNLSSGQQILLVLIITSVSCAIIGSFLVLRKLSMVSDALSHSVLLGIVVAFFVTNDVASPWLIVGAAIFGIFTVMAIEVLSGSGMVKNDDAVGIIFPLFFSLAVILITKYARNVHIDTDMVLMGEVIMAPLAKITVAEATMPKAFLYMGIMLLINVVFITVFYKELKVSTFDGQFATIAGFSSVALFYALMSLTSFTTVVAFDAVGAILVISFLTAPGASAYLITKDLKWTVILSGIFGAVNAILGYTLSMRYNVSMSGMTATMAGMTFLLTFLFNKDGYITSMMRKIRNRKNYRMEILIMHIGNHMGESCEIEELGIRTLEDHLQWKHEDLLWTVERLINQGILRKNEKKEIFQLTDRGFDKFNKIKKSYGM
ncbi:MAG: metal ABC transporter permease [Tissierellia bacterium]|nr:metal ABC transporter permease [Tissierellia bacterium]